jgi:hypothetical protein
VDRLRCRRRQVSGQSYPPGRHWSNPLVKVRPDTNMSSPQARAAPDPDLGSLRCAAGTRRDQAAKITLMLFAVPPGKCTVRRRIWLH